MKEDTRSFYGAIVRRTVARIANGLDEALDLAALAHDAALSPLHFHRIFRGMSGETPLEMHRRLRLERAASRLSTGDDSVTRAAFDAGYETHESFTRAFRDAFGVPPTEFRARAQALPAGCERPPQVELSSPSGIHFGQRTPLIPTLSLKQGEAMMKVDIETKPALRVVTVHHRGPYHAISEAFERLGTIAGPLGFFARPGAAMVAIYHDDPETKPASELHSDAGVVVTEDAAVPKELGELRIPAGKYARTTHVGPYSLLGDAWSRFLGSWLPESGQRIGNGISYEVYLNNPQTTKPEELCTELYCSIE